MLARGDIPCDVLFIGEAPGMSEDTLGSPFVGPAGKRLDSIIEGVWQSMNSNATTCFINLVGCFPREAKKTDDHRPDKKSIQICADRVREMVSMCRPKLIVCVGTLAKDWIHLSVDEASEAYDIIHITHPSAILQAPDPNKPLMIKRVVAALQNGLAKLGERS